MHSRKLASGRALPALSSLPGLLYPTPPLLPGFYWTDEKTRFAPLYPMPPGKFAPVALASALTPTRAALRACATPWLLLDG